MNRGLVKSVQFKSHRYIGDPINAVRIFNDHRADELVFLDILAGKENRTISPALVRQVGEEANMPFSCGGGIQTLEQIRQILAAGAEKVVINSHAVKNPAFVKTASDEFGSSTIIVCIDVKKNMFSRKFVYSGRASERSAYKPLEFARLMEEMGAGEIILQSVDMDGVMGGYDMATLHEVAAAVSIPVVALGGAGSLEHMSEAYNFAGCSALAAGSLFVYHGQRRGILINYPDVEIKRNLFR